MGEHSGLYFGGVLSVIKEQGSFLGASGRGLFDGTEGLTQSLTLGLALNAGMCGYLGRSPTGQTRIKSGLTGALLSDFSNIRTSAALIGISKQRVFKDTDRFDIILARPLKVYSASAQLNADRDWQQLGDSSLTARPASPLPPTATNQCGGFLYQYPQQNIQPIGGCCPD